MQNSHQSNFHLVLVYYLCWQYECSCKQLLCMHTLGMTKVESQTEDKKRIIIQKSKICNYGRARYLYENAVAREPGYTLSRSFQNSINHQLPLHYNERAYMQFIENWGTVNHLLLYLCSINPLYCYIHGSISL